MRVTPTKAKFFRPLTHNGHLSDIEERVFDLGDNVISRLEDDCDAGTINKEVAVSRWIGNKEREVGDSLLIEGRYWKDGGAGEEVIYPLGMLVLV